MSRFYQTTATELQDDFIFQPDWEMARQAVIKQDEIAGEAISTMEMMGNPLFEFDEQADGEAALRVKEMWEGVVNDLASKASDIKDPRELKKLVAQSRRKLEKDYEHGEIRAIEDNARRIREYEEQLKGLDPEARELWRKRLEEYRNEGAGTAIDRSPFQEQDIFDVDLSITTFAASPFAQSIKPHIRGELTMTTDGVFMKTDGISSEIVTEEEIMDRYKAWVKNQRGVQGRIEYGERFGEENWRDEEGNIRFDEESYLGSRAKEGIKELAYSNIQEENRIAYDDKYLLELQFAEQRRAAREAREAQRNKNNMQFGFHGYSEAFEELTAEGQAIAKKYDEEIQIQAMKADPGKYTLLYEHALGLKKGEKFDPYDVPSSLSGKDREAAIADRRKARTEASKMAMETVLNFAKQDPEYGPIIHNLERRRQEDLSTGSDVFLRAYPSADLEEIHGLLNGPELRGKIPKMAGTLSFGRGSDGKMKGIDLQTSGEARGKIYTAAGPYEGWIIKDVVHNEGGNTFNHFGSTLDSGHKVLEFNSDVSLVLERPTDESAKGKGASDEAEATVPADYMTRDSNVVLKGY